MEQRNNTHELRYIATSSNVGETEFGVRKLRCVEEYENGHIEMATEASVTELPTKLDLNSRYGITGQVIRPTIQFVHDTTEIRLEDVREQMTFTKAKKTIRRTGWYFTEPYAPCGAAIDIPVIRLERERYV